MVLFGAKWSFAGSYCTSMRGATRDLTPCVPPAASTMTSVSSALLARLRQNALLGLELPAALLSKTFDFAKWLPYTHPIMQTRGRHVEERDLELEVGPSLEEDRTSTSGRGDPATPLAKQPCHSHLQLRYPFSTSMRLRQLYSSQGPHGLTHNVALWLEDMDTFAADVGGRHCDIGKGDKKQVSDLSDDTMTADGAAIKLCFMPNSVTAFLESFVWLEPACLDTPTEPVLCVAPSSSQGPESLVFPHDIQLSGQVTWVGKSSMEVTLELWAHSAADRTSSGNSETGRAGAATAPSQSEPRALAVARFVMAARSLDLASSVAVAPLQLTSDADQARFQQGQQGHVARQDRRMREKAKHPPTADELALLVKLMGSHHHKAHTLHLASSAPATHQAAGSGMAAELATNAVAMSATRLHHVTTTTEEDVNTSGSTFGGHLLTLGYEHAVRVAAAHCGCPVHLLTMTEVAFLALVPIGAELHLGDVVRVFVTAFMLGKQGEAQDLHQAGHHRGKTVAQRFWFAFQACPQGLTVEASGVESMLMVAPDTPEEVDLFLHALRQHNADMQ